MVQIKKNPEKIHKYYIFLANFFFISLEPSETYADPSLSEIRSKLNLRKLTKNLSETKKLKKIRKFKTVEHSYGSEQCASFGQKKM